MRNRSWWSITNRYEIDSAMDIKQNQGKISGVQLENYRRNSETREALEEEDQSSSSSSRLIFKEFFWKTTAANCLRWRMKDVVGRFSPIRPKLGSLKGSLKRRRKDEGEDNTRGRIREVQSTVLSYLLYTYK